ncbi:MAG TPA: replication initiator protein A [Oculatellaceae cyanobacterium]
MQKPPKPLEATQLRLVHPQLERWQPVRDDFNFCRLAFFVAGDKLALRFRDIEQKYIIEVNNQKFEAVWEVRHDSKLGLPGSFDRDVWLGILEIVAEITRGRKPIPERIEIGSFSEFLKRLGRRSDGGRDIALLKQAIERLATTGCISRRAYKSDGAYIKLGKVFHLISEWGFKGEAGQGGTIHETNWITLGEHVRRNLETGYVSLIDVRFVRGLKGEITKQLYPFLSYRFWLALQHGRDWFPVHWHDLRDYLAASGWDKLSRAKQRLKQALEELKLFAYIHESSDWHGETYHFRAGDKFIDELRNRLDAKEQFRSWIHGKVSNRQLSIFPDHEPKASEPVSDATDERESILTRQAIRIALLGEQPNLALLAQHGWTEEDAQSLAATLKKKPVPSIRE